MGFSEGKFLLKQGLAAPVSLHRKDWK